MAAGKADGGGLPELLHYESGFSDEGLNHHRGSKTGCGLLKLQHDIRLVILNLCDTNVKRHNGNKVR